MTQDTQPKLYDLSRRQVLGGLGAVGLASAGAGLGTSAFFRDDESVSAALDAGRVDLRLDYRSTYVPWLPIDEVRSRLLGENMGPVAPLAEEPDRYHIDSVPVPQAPDADNPIANAGFALNGDGTAPSAQAWGDAVKAIDPCADDLGLVDGDEGVFLELIDLKPYDAGETTFSLHVCGNPAYLYNYVTDFSNAENDRLEPEAGSGDPSDSPAEGIDEFGELADYLYVEVFYDDDCDNRFDDGDDVPLFAGSLQAYVDFIQGAPDGLLPLARSPTAGEVPSRQIFESGNYCYVLDWQLPCKPEDFVALSSNAPIPDFDGDGEITLADELLVKGLPLDANVVQSDTVTLGLGFEAVQSRHNMAMDDPAECIACDFDVPADEMDAATITSINASSFPQVDVFARVDTAAGADGSLVGNFRLCEDDCLQDPVASFTSVDQQVDIAFVIDVTGSMGDEIDDVRNNVDALVDDINASGTDAQYGIELYADDDSDGTGVLRFQDLTDVSTFQTALAGVDLGEGALGFGGDLPEDAYDAIASVDGSLAGGPGALSWRDGSQRVVVVLTDARADLDDATSRADAVDILSGASSGSGASGYTFIAISPGFTTTDSMRNLAEDPAVGGSWIDLRSADFSAVLAEIATTVTTTYRLRYTSTNSPSSGDTLPVTIEVADPVAGTLFEAGDFTAP